MALNFTGRLPPEPVEEPRRGRTSVIVVACFVVAAVLAALVFAAALRQHRAQIPIGAPPLVGADVPAGPSPAAPAPAPAAAKAPAGPAPKILPAGPGPAEAARDEGARKARMLAALRQVPDGRISLQVEDNPAARAFALKLRSLFEEAGWSVDESAAFGSGPPRQGLAAALGDGPADEAVRQAFDAVGFRFLPPPPDAGVIRSPEIFVGTPVSAAPHRPSPAPAPDGRP